MGQTNYDFKGGKIEGFPMGTGGENFETGYLFEDIPYGFFVVAGTGTVKLPAATGQVQLGVFCSPQAFTSYENYSITKTLSTGVTRVVSGQKAKTVGSIMTRGKIPVYSETAMALTDKVFVRHTATGTNGQTGVIRNDADTAKADECKFARVVEATSGAGLCWIEVNRP